MFGKKKIGKGRTKEQGPKQVLIEVRNPRRLLAMVQRGEMQALTIRGYADGVTRAAQRYLDSGYEVSYEVLEWEDEQS